MADAPAAEAGAAAETDAAAADGQGAPPTDGGEEPGPTLEADEAGRPAEGQAGEDAPSLEEAGPSGQAAAGGDGGADVAAERASVAAGGGAAAAAALNSSAGSGRGRGSALEHKRPPPLRGVGAGSRESALPGATPGGGLLWTEASFVSTVTVRDGIATPLTLPKRASRRAARSTFLLAFFFWLCAGA